MSEQKAANKLTASAARKLLCEKDPHFHILGAPQKVRVAVEFARAGKVVYGQAFDLVRTDVSVDFDDSASIAQSLDKIFLYEIKSTNRALSEGFAGYFFSLSTAELLVAQSLGDRFRFVFINIKTHELLDLSLREVFAKARGIYPSWSIKF
jgi:hypothetical protein